MDYIKVLYDIRKDKPYLQSGLRHILLSCMLDSRPEGLWSMGSVYVAHAAVEKNKPSDRWAATRRDGTKAFVAKIGSSANPQSRIKQLRYTYGWHWYQYCDITCWGKGSWAKDPALGETVERALHAYFDENRFRPYGTSRELFLLSDEDKSFIKSIKHIDADKLSVEICAYYERSQ